MTEEKARQIDIRKLHDSKRHAYEMHLHTGEFGWCAKVPAATIVATYEEIGYTGLVVTNHYFEDGFEAMPESSWAGKVDHYLRGYEAARRAVSKDDFHVLPGMEIRFNESWNDYLVYGVNREQLIQYPELYKYSPEKFRLLADELGWIFVQAHPFRKNMKVISPALLHGVETFNMNPRHDSRNDLAFSFAKENHLLGTAGSDYHQIGDEAQAAMSFSEPVTGSEELAKILRTEYDNLQSNKAAVKPQSEIKIHYV